MQGEGAGSARTDPLDELDAQLARLRNVADELRGTRGRPMLNGNQVELIEDGATLHRAYQQLQRDARREVRVLDRPPYLTPTPAQHVLERQRLADGIVYRAVYGTEIFGSESRMAALAGLQAEGEQARVLAQVPMKMAVGDDDTVLIALTKRAPSEQHLLVRSSGLMDGLIATFEMLWALAVPMPAMPFTGDLPGPRPNDRDILLLLASGATDDMISRRLRISPRTTQRRVRALMESLGAQTRFQAGVRAAHRRWI